MKRFDIVWEDKLNDKGELCAIVKLYELVEPLDIRFVGQFAIEISIGIFRTTGIDGDNLPPMTEAEHHMLKEICYTYYDCFMGQHSIYFWAKD